MDAGGKPTFTWTIDDIDEIFRESVQDFFGGDLSGVEIPTENNDDEEYILKNLADSESDTDSDDTDGDDLSPANDEDSFVSHHDASKYAEIVDLNKVPKPVDFSKFWDVNDDKRQQNELSGGVDSTNKGELDEDLPRIDELLKESPNDGNVGEDTAELDLEELFRSWDQ